VKYAVILGEDRSDAETLCVLVRRLLGQRFPNKQLPALYPKGYHGWAELVRKGPRDLRALHSLGWQRFIVCVDADGPDPAPRHKVILAQVIKKAQVPSETCALVPVQELEAWILADIEQVSEIIAAWRPSPITKPEGIASPKEHLRRLSRDPVTKKARYNEVRDNKRMASHLRLEIVHKKCKSFRPLVKFVAG
jgi:Domain of unknown function (DUF4276)